MFKSAIAFLISVLIVVTCSFFVPDIDADSCESVSVRCVREDLPSTNCRIEMAGCMLNEIFNSCDGEWRFYYRHEEGSWQYVLVELGGICPEGCTAITCAVDGLSCGDRYDWYIICSDEGSTPWRSGYVVCPLN